MRRDWLLMLASCATTPPAPKPDVDPLPFTWLISSHEMGTLSTLSEDDALGAYGREVVITPTGYTTPWHGMCEEAKREHSEANLVEITADVDVSPEGRARLKQFGLAPKLTEYRLTCQTKTVPPLTLWITGNRAMTCFGGICYLLSH